MGDYELDCENGGWDNIVRALEDREARLQPERHDKGGLVVCPCGQARLVHVQPRCPRAGCHWDDQTTVDECIEVAEKNLDGKS